MPHAARLAVVGAVALVAVACAGDEPGDAAAAESEAAPTIVVTTSIWADIVTNVTCDGLASVELIIGAGVDPHAFEPSLADREAMADAALVVANGLGLEERLDDTIAAVEADGTPVWRAGDHVDPLEYPDGGADPHIWFDPTRVAAALPDLADQIVAAGVEASEVDRCRRAYEEVLDEVDTEIMALVAPLTDEQRRLVTNHDSFGYFADRYGFTIIGTVIPNPSGLADTNPAQLEALAEVIETTGVGVVFAETQHSTDDVEAIAERVGGIEIVTLPTDTLDEPGTEATTYVGLLRLDARLITESLS